MSRLVLHICVILNLVATVALEDCQSKNFGYESIVCVCNESFCDTLAPVSATDGEFIQITSSKSGKRWKQQRVSLFGNPDNDFEDSTAIPDVILIINQTKTFQKILGFGAAFTDATGYNLNTLPDAVQRNVMKSYFSHDGLEYNIGRVPMGGTDFSTHPYSYVDLPPGHSDPNLAHFRLTSEDLEQKIPYIIEAINKTRERGVELKLYSSPWSAPGWMKDNGKLNGRGSLLKKYYSTWAKYFVRFFESYKSHGIQFSATTTGNEPLNGLIDYFPFNCMGWTAENQGHWIANYLGPQLKESSFGNISIFIGDDQRFFMPNWVETVMKVPKAKDYVGGVAVHWYFDFLTNPNLLDGTNNLFPDLPILYTEACSGYSFWDPKKVILGSWIRAEDYAHDIIENLGHWVVGWTDWNMVLDLQGGPNWVSNFVDSPIIANENKKEVYKQPMYYALAHFSKIFPRDSIRIEVTSQGAPGSSVQFIAFKRPDGGIALTVLNKMDNPVRLLIEGDKIEKDLILEERSISSFVWKV